MVLSTHNCELNTRIKRLYWFQPSPVAFACKTACFGPEKQISRGPRQHLSFCACNTAGLAPCFYGSQPSSVVLCMQNSDFRTRLTCLYGSQTSSVVLSTDNCVLNTRIKRLYVFQPSPVVLCMQNSDFSTWIASLYRSQASSVFFAYKTASFGPE